eukprot:851588-Alexandrium_andersonii.AAC.1
MEGSRARADFFRRSELAGRRLGETEEPVPLPYRGRVVELRADELEDQARFRPCRLGELAHL